MNHMIGPAVVILLLAGCASVDKRPEQIALEPAKPTSEAKVQPLDVLTVLQATATAVWCSLDRHRGGVSSPALCRTLGSRHKKDGTHKSQSPLFKELE